MTEEVSGWERALILKNRNFKFLWLGQVVSQLGDKIFAMALIWWLLAITTSEQHPTGRADMVSYLMAAATLPAALFGPVAGALADNYPRQKLMIAADLGRSAIVLCLVALALCGATPILLIFTLAFCLSLFSVLFNPCLQAVIPSLVSKEELIEAIAWQQMTRDSANIFGAALGGLLIAAIGAVLAFVFNAASFLVSAAMISLIPFSLHHANQSKARQQLKDGIMFLKNNEGLLRLLAGFAALNLFIVPVFVFIPSYAKGTLHGNALTFGALEVCVAAGSLLTAVSMKHILVRVSRSSLVPAAVFLCSLCILILGMFPSLWIAPPALCVLGGSLAACNIAMRHLYQDLVPDEMKGRFFALVETISFASFPLAFLWSGAAAGHLTVPTVLISCGTGGLLVAVFFRSLPITCSKSFA